MDEYQAEVERCARVVCEHRLVRHELIAIDDIDLFDDEIDALEDALIALDVARVRHG